MTKEIEGRLAAAVKDLSEAGWSRTKIYELVRDSLPPSNWEEKQRLTSIKDIEVMIDLLSGIKVNEVKAKYSLNSLARKSAIYQGYRKTIRTLELSVTTDDKTVMDKVNHDFWIEQGRLALNRLLSDKVD